MERLVQGLDEIDDVFAVLRHVISRYASVALGSFTRPPNVRSGRAPDPARLAPRAGFEG